MPVSARQRNLIEVHAAAFLLGFVGLVIKASDAPLVIIAGGRSVFAALFLVLFLIYRKESLSLQTWRDYFFLALLGILQAIQWLTFFQAVRVSSVAVGLLALFTFPAFVALLEPLFFAGRLRITHLVSALFLLGGIALVVPEVKLENSVTQGVLWGVLSALLVAFPLLIHRRYIQKYSSPVLTFYKTAVSALVLLPLFGYFTFDCNEHDLLLIGLLGIFLTAIPYLLFIQSLQTLKASQVSAIISLEVVYGIVFSALLLHEIPGWRTASGGAIILGVTLYLTIEAKREENQV